MLLYLYGKCSTCQQAKRFLEARNVSFECKEITLQPPTMAELRTMLGYTGGQIKKICNTSGQLYRQLNLATELNHMTEEAVLQLLSQHGMLIKRPFLLGDGFGCVGFNKETWSKLHFE